MCNKLDVAGLTEPVFDDFWIEKETALLRFLLASHESRGFL
jgi:hypothetical protein